MTDKVIWWKRENDSKFQYLQIKRNIIVDKVWSRGTLLLTKYDQEEPEPVLMKMWTSKIDHWTVMEFHLCEQEYKQAIEQ